MEAFQKEQEEQRFEASPRGKFIRSLRDALKQQERLLETLLAQEELAACITSLEDGREALRYLENAHLVVGTHNIDSKMYAAQRRIQHLQLAIQVMVDTG